MSESSLAGVHVRTGETQAHRDGPVKTGRDQSHVYKPRVAGNHPEAGRVEEGLSLRFFREHDFEDSQS